MRAVSMMLAAGLALAASFEAAAAERPSAAGVSVPAAVPVAYASGRYRRLHVRVWRWGARSYARRGYRCYEVAPFYCRWPAYDVVAVGAEPDYDAYPTYRDAPAPPWRRPLRHRRPAVVSARG